MPSYHVARSITIDKPLQYIKDSLRNFKQWPKWSPWLIMEPEAVVIYSDRQGQVGATYGWSGVLIGAGSMELMEVHDESLVMQIYFTKPFKSTAKVSFDFVEVEEGVSVTWSMHGDLAFYMFWMKKMMRTLIGMDYERGLLMLKEYLETGSVDSYVIIEGVVSMQNQRYIGIPNACAIKDIAEVMKKDFELLYTFMKEKEISIKSVPFSIYNTFDIFKQQSSFISCIPLDENIDIDKSWVQGTVESKHALKTIHKGRYLHLGNGWMTTMNFARLKKIKTTKIPVGYEYYPNNPYDTPEEKLITEIYLPVR